MFRFELIVVVVVDEQEEWLDDSLLPVYHPVHNEYDHNCSFYYCCYCCCRYNN